MTSYRETFLRHRVLLTMPVVVAVFVAMWWALGAPKSYESTASLWVDNAPPGDSSVADTNPALRSPSEREQLVLGELLRTRDFRLAVARRGPLAEYLAHHRWRGWGPPALLPAGSTERRITGALGPKHVDTTVAGPQVLQIDYKGPTPAVAAGTLSALVQEYDKERFRLDADRAQATKAYWKSQVDAASKTVGDANRNLQGYLAAHVGVPPSDPELKALRRAAKDAAKQLAGATTRYTQARFAVPPPRPDAGALEVLDTPKVPKGPVSGHKNVALAFVGGLFGGALISLLGLVALTPGRSDTWSAPVRRPVLPAGNGTVSADAGPTVLSEIPSPAVAATRAPAAANGNGDAEAFRGTIVDVGRARRTRPIWMVHEPAGSEPRLDVGSSVHILDPAGGEGVVRERRDAEDGGSVLEVEITVQRFGKTVEGTDGRRALAATDARWLGREVAFAATPVPPSDRNGATADA